MATGGLAHASNDRASAAWLTESTRATVLNRLTQRARDRLAHYLREDAVAEQIAAAASVGIAVGCMRPGLVLGLTLIACCRAACLNLYVMLPALVAGMLVAAGIEPMLHRLGFMVLTWPVLTKLWACLFDLPLVPWTRLNHTVTMGGLLTGLYLACPVYLLCDLAVRRMRTSLGIVKNDADASAATPAVARDDGDSEEAP